MDLVTKNFFFLKFFKFFEKTTSQCIQFEVPKSKNLIGRIAQESSLKSSDWIEFDGLIYKINISQKTSFLKFFEIFGNFFEIFKIFWKIEKVEKNRFFWPISILKIWPSNVKKFFRPKSFFKSIVTLSFLEMRVHCPIQ